MSSPLFLELIPLKTTQLSIMTITNNTLLLVPTNPKPFKVYYGAVISPST